LVVEIAAECIEANAPEFFIAGQPHGGLLHRLGKEFATDHPALLRPGDQAGVLQHPQVFHEPGERHGVRLSKLGHAEAVLAERRQNVSPSRIRQRGKHQIQVDIFRLNHLVLF